MRSNRSQATPAFRIRYTLVGKGGKVVGKTYSLDDALRHMGQHPSCILIPDFDGPGFTRACNKGRPRFVLRGYRRG